MIKYLKILIIFLLLTNIVSAATISIESKTVKVGQNFLINVTVNPGTNISGLQANVKYDPTLLKINSVTEGNLLTQYSTFFNPGTINNGMLINTYDLILGKYSINNPGTYIIINFTSLSKGTSILSLENVILASPQSTAIPTTTINSTLVVHPKEDINTDGSINILDLIAIGAHFGEYGETYDINGDNIINILDLIYVSKSFGT